MTNVEKGKLGESIAAEYLTGMGVEIIKKNYSTKFGEIDLIGIEKKTIIFIEVKLRCNDKFGTPEEAVNPGKLERIYQVAECYLVENDVELDSRFDVVSVRYDLGSDEFQIDWLKNQYFY